MNFDHTTPVLVIRADGERTIMTVMPFADRLAVPLFNHWGRPVGQYECHRVIVQFPLGWHGPFESHFEIDPDGGMVYTFAYQEGLLH